MTYKFKDTLNFDFIGDADNSLKDEVYGNQLFQNWMKSLDDSLILKSVELQSFIRGESGLMEYIKISTITERNGGKIPRIIILQGYAISALIVVHSIETRIPYVILQHKVIIATGNYQSAIPYKITGTTEPNCEIAASFIKEETGIICQASEIINLPEKATNNKIKYVHPYCGPTDQKNLIFLLEREMHEDEIKSLDGKEIRPNEKLNIIPLDKAESTVHDFVSLTPFAYYSKLHE